MGISLLSSALVPESARDLGVGPVALWWHVMRTREIPGTVRHAARDKQPRTFSWQIRNLPADIILVKFKLCSVYTALLKCAAECSQDDLNLLMNHTIHASYVCKDKMEGALLGCPILSDCNVQRSRPSTTASRRTRLIRCPTAAR